jgi:hypothetical protein
MAHDPQAGSYQPGDGKTIQDYDEGERHQRAALAHVAARGNVPAAPGPEAYGSGQLIRTANPLTMYHGTPHEFRGTRANPLGEFDLSKLGTGEGAQAYGRGVYQAGRKSIAEGYRDELTPGPTYKGRPTSFSHTDPHAAAADAVAQRMQDSKISAHEAIERVRHDYNTHATAALDNARQWDDPETKERYHQRARHYLAITHHVQTLDPAGFEQGAGHLYESELHIHPDHMLDWDKKISEHSPYVQNRLGPVLQEHGLTPGTKTLDPLYQFHPSPPAHAYTTQGDMTGNSLVGSLTKRTGSHEAAAMALLQAGIPGIRYEDAASRNLGVVPATLRDGSQGWGVFNTRTRSGGMAEFRTKEEADAHVEASRTCNCVVFDPRTLNVVKRNGL